MECHHNFTPILDSRPRSSHLQQGYRRSIFSIFLLTIKSYNPSAIWQNTIWLFVITLNRTFDWQLLLADEGYESGSDTINLPTLLRKTPRIHHVSSIEHALFNPELVTPWNMPWTPPRPVCRWLSFSSTDDDNIPA